VDRILFAVSASDAQPMTIPARGNCSYSNPYIGPARINCSALTQNGQFSASFLSDGREPSSQAF
jgi:hypothetical protein